MPKESLSPTPYETKKTPIESRVRRMEGNMTTTCVGGWDRCSNGLYRRLSQRPSHQNAIASQRHHFSTPAHHHTIASSRHHAITRARHHAITPSRHRISTPSRHHAIASARRRISTPSRHHAITSSRHHAITPSRHHAITPSAPNRARDLTAAKPQLTHLVV